MNNVQTSIFINHTTLFENISINIIYHNSSNCLHVQLTAHLKYNLNVKHTQDMLLTCAGFNINIVLIKLSSGNLISMKYQKNDVHFQMGMFQIRVVTRWLTSKLLNG